MFPSRQQYKKWSLPSKWGFWSAVIGLPITVLSLTYQFGARPVLHYYEKRASVRSTLINIRPGMSDQYINSLIGPPIRTENWPKGHNKFDIVLNGYKQCLYDYEGNLLRITFNPDGQSEMVSVMVLDKDLLPISIYPGFSIGSITFQKLGSEPEGSDFTPKNYYYSESLAPCEASANIRYFAIYYSLGPHTGPSPTEYLTMDDSGDLIEIQVRHKTIPPSLLRKVNVMRGKVRPNGWAMLRTDKIDDYTRLTFIFDPALRYRDLQ